MQVTNKNIRDFARITTKDQKYALEQKRQDLQNRKIENKASAKPVEEQKYNKTDKLVDGDQIGHKSP